MKIKESTVLERICKAIDEMDTDDLAKLYNETTNNKPIKGSSIIVKHPGCYVVVN